jgi:hypothetical protein
MENATMAHTANRFKRGSGVFACGSCGRKTRDTGGDNTSAQRCAECYEAGGIENELSDYGASYTPEQIEACEKRIAELTQKCIEKGGKL